MTYQPIAGEDCEYTLNRETDNLKVYFKCKFLFQDEEFAYIECPHLKEGLEENGLQKVPLDSINFRESNFQVMQELRDEMEDILDGWYLSAFDKKEIIDEFLNTAKKKGLL